MTKRRTSRKKKTLRTGIVGVLLLGGLWVATKLYNRPVAAPAISHDLVIVIIATSKTSGLNPADLAATRWAGARTVWACQGR
jgi:hypothetical protein